MASNYEVRKFDTGATRDAETNKPDYEGFLSPLVIERYGAYMSKHRVQPDGALRESDNWQLGIPLNAYMKSGYRHFIDWWKQHRGYKSSEDLEDSLCALIFNASGYLHELRKRALDPRTPSDRVHRDSRPKAVEGRGERTGAVQDVLQIKSRVVCQPPKEDRT